MSQETTRYMSRFCWRAHRLRVGDDRVALQSDSLCLRPGRGYQVLVGHLRNSVVGKENRAGQMEVDEDF